MVQLRDCFFFRVALIIAAGPSLKAFLFLCCFLYNSPLAPVVTRRSYYCICCCDLSCFLIITEQFFALTAGPVLGIACLGACCSLRFGLLKRMAFRCYYCIRCRDLCCSLIITEQFFALTAGPVLGITGLGAGCFLRVGLLERMAFCRYYCIRCRDLCCSLIITEQFFALTAGPVFGITGLSAGCILRFGLLKRMALCCYYCICCRDLCCSLIITEQLFAYAAGPILGVTSFGARRILRVGLLERMAFCRYYCIRCRDLCCSLIITEQFFALTAGPVFGITGLSAGCILRFGLLKRMALCCYYCICCRDLCCSLIITEQLFAYAAGPVLGITGFGAGCFLRFGLLKRMTFCRHYCICCRDLSRSFFIAEQLFTLNAGPVLDVAGLGASSILRFCLNQIVNMLQLAERNFVLVVIIQRILII